MLEPVRSALNKYKVVLASSSPRRKEILQHAGIPNGFEVVASQAEENLDKVAYGSKPWQFAVDTSRLKAEEVYERLTSEKKGELFFVIGADTVIGKDGVIYGKPKDSADALRTLGILSGSVHRVYTGVSLIYGSEEKGRKTAEFYQETEVTFDNLSEEVIKAYVATGEPMDKAASYGIQAGGGALVKSITGDFFNVMGFPLNKFCVQVSNLLTEEV